MTPSQLPQEMIEPYAKSAYKWANERVGGLGDWDNAHPQDREFWIAALEAAGVPALQERAEKAERERDEARGCADDLAETLDNTPCVDESHASLQEEVERLREIPCALVDVIAGVKDDCVTRGRTRDAWCARCSTFAALEAKP